jgi:drug/metabolite transporter (DMT)-like permease
MTKEKWVNWMIFVALSIVWGSSFILMKKSAESLSGAQIAAIRVMASGLVFLPFGIYNLMKIQREKLGLVFLTGILGSFIPAFLFAIAIDRQVDSSLAGILNSLTPLFVVLIGILFFHSSVSRRKIAGVLVGLIGLILLSLSRGSISLSEMGSSLLILLATLLYGLNVNIVSHRLKEVPPMRMASVSLSFIGIPAIFITLQLDVISLAQNDQSSHWPIAASALLGIVGTAISTVVFYILIKRAGGLFASLVTYGIPVVSIIWGLWDHENVTALQVGCLGLILGGVYVANK